MIQPNDAGIYPNQTISVGGWPDSLSLISVWPDPLTIVPHPGAYYHPRPHLCPVCLGRTIVPRDFYGATENDALVTQCRSCEGIGVLWR